MLKKCFGMKENKLENFIKAKEAWNNNFDGREVQACRHSDIELSGLVWKTVNMFDLTQEELVSETYVFRLAPLIINGIEHSPPLTQEEIRSCRAAEIPTYGTIVSSREYCWRTPSERDKVVKSLTSLLFSKM